MGVEEAVERLWPGLWVDVEPLGGGIKQSGFDRELGLQAMDGYSEVKTVFISTEG